MCMQAVNNCRMAMAVARVRWHFLAIVKGHTQSICACACQRLHACQRLCALASMPDAGLPHPEPSLQLPNALGTCNGIGSSSPRTLMVIRDVEDKWNHPFRSHALPTRRPPCLHSLPNQQTITPPLSVSRRSSRGQHERVAQHRTQPAPSVG